MKLDGYFKVVIEPTEYKEYRKALGSQCLLVLDFHDLGQGSIPARNWIWEHALSEGHKRHWIMDDNIKRFYRMNVNRRIPCRSAGMLSAAEDFTDRFTNVALSGLMHVGFANENDPRIPPFSINSRVYSCSLILTSLPYRWRGRYNEDTDLSLRALKDGWATINFNAFLMQKGPTQKIRGGNTDTVYAEDPHRKEFAESLKRQHPDVTTVKWKFGRWHHSVNYQPFRKTKLILRDDITPLDRVNEYGMELRRIKEIADPT